MFSILNNTNSLLYCITGYRFVKIFLSSVHGISQTSVSRSVASVYDATHYVVVNNRDVEACANSPNKEISVNPNSNWKEMMCLEQLGFDKQRFTRFK